MRDGDRNAAGVLRACLNQATGDVPGKSTPL